MIPSIWEKEALLSTEVLIVGGGITGLSTALSLKEIAPELQIKLLDASWFAQGASTRNAGFACFGSLTELLEDLAKLGEEGMLALVEQRWKGLQKLRSRIPDTQTEYRAVGGYELLRGDGSQSFALESMEDMNQRLKPLFPGEKVFQTASLPSAHRFGAPYDGELIFNPYEGHLHTGKLMQALFRKATALGVEIHTGLRVEGFASSGSGFKVRAAYGKEEEVAFFAHKLVFCTNAFTPRFFPELEIKPGRGVVVLTEPFEKLPFQGTFHYDAGYFYFRDFGNRILFGGARNYFMEQESTTRMEVPEKLLEVLNQHLEEVILPGAKPKIDMAWSGIMAFGAVKQPLVGQLQEGVWGGFRLGGMGVAIGSAIGEQLAEMVLGKREAPELRT